MKTVIQRVVSAKLFAEGIPISEIGRGLVVYVGIEAGDTPETAIWFAKKIANLRIFEDCGGKMNFSALRMSYEVLVVSQFTLCGDCSKGNRPDFTGAEHPEKAIVIFERFVEALSRQGVEVKQGVFGAHMRIAQDNDGPVTIVL